MSLPRDQTFVAIAETKDPCDAVPMVEFHHDPTDDIVQSRTEPAAGNNRGGCFPGIEVNLLTRASHLEIERTEPSFEHVPHSLHRIVVDDAMLFRSKPVYSSMPVPQGR